jgi:hypothetical protein
LEALEARRNSRALVIAATSLDLDLLPPLYDILLDVGRAERLDVIFYCRGGSPNAARRVALLLRGFTDYLSFIVPDRCESSGTITVLAGDEIVAGPVAIFSPVDPLLQAPPSSSEEGPLAISAQDVRLFGEMSREWFGLEPEEARSKAMSVLCENIFPSTLTSFYRSTLEVEAICGELLSLHMGEAYDERKGGVVRQLLFGHHSHGFALTREDLAGLGLPLRRDRETEELAWEIGRALRVSLGGGARAAPEDDWFDAVLATRTELQRRRRRPGGLNASWDTGAPE